MKEKTVLIARMAALKQGMAAAFDSKRFFCRAIDVLKDTIAFVDHEGLYVHVHSHNVRSRHIMWTGKGQDCLDSWRSFAH